MKPIAAYAPAIENNLITYSTLLNDTPANYNGWTPKNWYKTHYGYVTTEFALEKSMNTIPVYLVNKLTPQVSFDFLTKELGITTLNKADMDLSPLGMGGTNGGVTTLESAAAFAVFGSGGIYNAPIFYTEVRDYKDNVILESYSESSAAISPDTATVMNHLLQNVVYGNEGTGRKAASYLPSMKIYAKTGTSDSSNDLWFVGGTPYYIASCWCGYDAQQSISDSAIAIKMWGNVMSSVHKNLPAKDFEDSGYAKQLEYCTHTGLIATNTCPSVKTGWYKSNNIPESCTTHKASVQEDDGEEKGDEQNGENSNE
jgi:penicillin-binding protein 1A